MSDKKIVHDIGHAMGVILPQSGFARLYMNGIPYGFYEMTDNPKRNWIKKIIHKDSLPEEGKVGSLYKGVSYSDGAFKPASLYVESDPSWYEKLYECENEIEGQAPYTDIKEFITWLGGVNENTSIEEISSKLEVDMFLKYMVIEYLVGHWDGYWVGGNNFYLYKNPISGKFLFISIDFDLTLGLWDPNPPETPWTSYKPRKTEVQQALVKKVLFNPNFQKKFEEFLTTTVQKTFNIKALGPRIDYLKEFLHDDIAWDKTVDPKAVAIEEMRVDTLEDSLNSYDNASCEAEYGIKEWIALRSEYVAQSFGINIPNEPDFSLGGVGNKIIKEKEDNKKTEDDGTFNTMANASSSGAASLNISVFSIIIMIIVSYIF